MDQLCRLCLTISQDMTCKLEEETKLLDKLSSLNIQIEINKSLPSLVCRQCTKMLNDFTNYRESVIINQYTLTEQLKKGTWDSFCQSFKHEVLIKTEANVEIEYNIGDLHVYDSPEAINDNHINTTDQRNKSARMNDNYCGLLKKNNTITVKEEKKTSTLKKENGTQRNISSKDQIKKRKQNTTKETKRKKIKAKEISLYTTDDLKVCKKEEKNIAEETQNKLELKSVEIESDVENSSLRTNDVGLLINDNKCLTCFKCLPTNTALIKHYRTEHLNVDKENNGTEFEKRNSKSKEIVPPLKSDRPFYCKICGRTFQNIYAIVRHARAHSNYTLSCSHGCGFSTAYQWALRTHEKLHEKDFKYKCGICNAGFNVKTWHDQHQNIHKNIKPFVCNFCGVAFHMDRYLTAHRSSVHANLIKGIKRLCPHCDRVFENARLYRIHLEEHVGKKKKKYLCDLCGKECSSREQLKYHNNSHLGLKPFACSVCNKRFNKKFNLTVHQKAHAGEKHLCQDCGKHFAQRSTLMRHARRCHPESKECKNVSEVIK